MKKEVYLRHSQRKYKLPRQNELSSTFSNTTLNTQISADNTSPSSPTKPDNPHLVLEDTLSASSVVSYPAGYLSSPIFPCIIATQEESISGDSYNVIIRKKEDGNQRDSGLGDEVENCVISMETELQNVGDVIKESINEESGVTESPNVTPKSLDVMLHDENH